MSISEIQQFQTEPAYWKIPIPELQERYNKLEEWMFINKNHPHFHIAQIRIQRMNNILAKKIKM